MLNKWTVLVGCMFIGCGGGDSTRAIQDGERYDEEEEQDEDGPVIEHTPVESAQRYEQAVAMIATVSDAGSGVSSVAVVFKRADETAWASSSLMASGDLWQGAIPAASVTGSAIHYYIEAVDLEGNVSTEPPGSGSDYFQFNVSPD